MFLANTNNSNSVVITFAVIGIIILAIVLPIIIVSSYNKKQNAKVEANSPYLKEIKAINFRYKFVDYGPTSNVKNFYLNSKRQYDTFDYNKKCSQYVMYNEMSFRRIVNAISKNKLLEKAYLEEIKNVQHTSDQALVESCKMKMKDFVKRETKLSIKIIKKAPTDFTLTIKWEYTSPAGRNHYSNYCVYKPEHIMRFLGPQKPTTHYIEKETRQSRPQQKPTNDRNKTVTFDDIESVDD